MVHYDGHEVAVVSTMGGAALVLHRTMPKGWIRGFVHRQPVVALSCAWALLGITMPLVIPPIRRKLFKLPTNQYEDGHAPYADKIVLPKY